MTTPRSRAAAAAERQQHTERPDGSHNAREQRPPHASRRILPIRAVRAQHRQGREHGSQKVSQADKKKRLEKPVVFIGHPNLSAMQKKCRKVPHDATVIT